MVRGGARLADPPEVKGHEQPFARIRPSPTALPQIRVAAMPESILPLFQACMVGSCLALIFIVFLLSGWAQSRASGRYLRALSHEASRLHLALSPHAAADRLIGHRDTGSLRVEFGVTASVVLDGRGQSRYALRGVVQTIAPLHWPDGVVLWAPKLTGIGRQVPIQLAGGTTVLALVADSNQANDPLPIATRQALERTWGISTLATRKRHIVITTVAPLTSLRDVIALTNIAAAIHDGRMPPMRPTLPGPRGTGVHWSVAATLLALLLGAPFVFIAPMVDPLVDELSFLACHDGGTVDYYLQPKGRGRSDMRGKCSSPSSIPGFSGYLTIGAVTGTSMFLLTFIFAGLALGLRAPRAEDVAREAQV